MRMWSFLPAILLILLQGPSAPEGTAIGDSRHTLFATLRRATSDPDLSKAIAVLLAQEEESVEKAPSVTESEPERQPQIPTTVGIARDGFSRSVRSRDGPR